ncbi:hypothetical protein CHU92_09990 [Flavobacterium cyanobacteriorum]|uniref:DUF3299 domain-containing protein n=1 Tax=Flavobacterium cyanobacteriorum TaxID=2022802 RepID=A0A255Z6T3_9FLAO|nr:hypothetical protein [Flavobacterium cyanobacteriorum]OYQ36340.1 hypothetical protein CHU92_09990 [Flavobacterium cyanobacteriorum]
MRKTIFIISALIISAFIFIAAGNPKQYRVMPMADNTAVDDTLTWKLLGQIKYIKKPSKDYPEGVMFPVINTTLKAKNKKPIVMSGFIIPIDNKNYALSKNVFASCFFCGQAGPETIMGIKFRNPNIKLKTDQYVTLQGTFRYNDNDIDDWIYHIENAVIVKGM